jgi:hypothetical protein
MIFQCGDLERALRTPDLMPDARAHAERCDECRMQLSLWTEISRAAPALHQEWESPDLWPQIRVALASEPRKAARGIRRFQWMLAIAATIVLAVLLSMPRRSAPRPKTAAAGTNRELLTDAALVEVQQAEAAYARSIANLAAVAQPQLERSSSPLAAAYREKLIMLDSAIAELKSTAAQNPYNAHLRTELASLYGEKHKTLQEWMNDAKHN